MIVPFFQVAMDFHLVALGQTNKLLIGFTLPSAGGFVLALMSQLAVDRSPVDIGSRLCLFFTVVLW